MKTMKSAKTYEQYIVNRLNKLEAVVDQLETEVRWKNENIEASDRHIKQLNDDLKFLAKLFKSKPFTSSDGRTADIYESENVWSTHDKESYTRLDNLVKFYTEQEMPF